MPVREELDFDEVIDRIAVPALKFNRASMERVFGAADLFPSWVADMDFRVAPEIVEQLVKRARHGVFGYEYRKDSLYEAVVEWYETRHHWAFSKEEILFSPSVLNSIAVLITLFTEEGDGIIVQPPVFFDFKLIINNNKRRLIKNPLRFEGGRYLMDFDDLEAKVSDARTKMLILCNPHNPVGRVWTQKELKRIGDICVRHGVLVIADEIHGDITFEGFRYTPFAAISDEFAEISFTCVSPAKSFNLAGTVNSMMVVPNAKRREICAAFYGRMEINKNNAFANVAVEEAYRHGGPWLDAVLEYLEGNVSFLRDFLARHISKVGLVEPEGTFLVWLDFRELGLGAKELERFLVEKASLALNAGHWFGREGAGFARLNIACPRVILEKALRQLHAAVDSLKDPEPAP